MGELMKIGKSYRAGSIPYDCVRQEICYRFDTIVFTTKTCLKIYNNDTESYEYWRVRKTSEFNWQDVILYLRGVDSFDERYYMLNEDLEDGQPLKQLNLSKSSCYEA